MSVLAVIAAAATGSLPVPHLAIARQVAGEGLPACTSYWPDGTITPCLPHFAAKGGGSVNGHSLNGSILFTRGALRRLTADEFALLAGHEIAHFYLGHNGSTHANELAADRLGAELACRAGYDAAAGASLYRFLRTDRNHPPAAQRVAAVLAVHCARRSDPPRLAL